MSKYNVKCTSCGIDISFDDTPENGKIECGVCGALIEFAIPEKKTILPKTNNPSTFNSMDTIPEKITPPKEKNTEKLQVTSSSGVAQIEMNTPPPIVRNLKKQTLPNGTKQEENVPVTTKKIPHIAILFAFLGLALAIILAFFALKPKKISKHSFAIKNPTIEKNEAVPIVFQPSPSTRINEGERILEAEKKRKSDEARFKTILLAEFKTNTEAIERGKDKSLNEIKEEIKIEQERLLNAKFPESMLEQIRQDANSKFNKDDFPPVEEKFPQEMLNKSTLEANEKYKLIQIGETITVPKRLGSGYVNITGTYNGIAGDKIIVKDNRILISDLPADIRDKIGEEAVNKRRTAYLRDKYYLPKENYEKQRRVELEKVRERVADYVQANYYVPKLEYAKTSKQAIEEKLFGRYGFVYNTTKNDWEYFGEYLHLKYSEFVNLKKEMSSLAQGSLDIQEAYNSNLGPYDEAIKSMNALKSKTFSKIFRNTSYSSDLAIKEKDVASLKAKLDDLNEQKKKTEKRIQEIKNIISKYEDS